MRETERAFRDALEAITGQEIALDDTLFVTRSPMEDENLLAAGVYTGTDETDAKMRLGAVLAGQCLFGVTVYDGVKIGVLDAEGRSVKPIMTINSGVLSHRSGKMLNLWLATEAFLEEFIREGPDE